MKSLHVIRAATSKDQTSQTVIKMVQQAWSAQKLVVPVIYYLHNIYHYILSLEGTVYMLVILCVIFIILVAYISANIQKIVQLNHNS